ncbi:putative quinol monooxygenase [Embleya sp. MST-111070]|uniref:putative quinol monooxygenase n=1 Tax=Embleya sp. MST-111070 TaxID=3398231 RepID=UPI003F732C5D
MIFIVVKFPVKPEHAEEWPRHAAAFTEATRGEPGNLWFEWSRSLDDPTTYVLVEAFRDDAAAAHVNSDHFRDALERFRPLIRHTPEIVSTVVPDASGWSEMGELRID